MTQHRTVLFPGGGPQLKESLADYSRRGGFEALRKVVAAANPRRVIEEIEKAGLRGRGGAGFPTAQKLALCAQAEGPEGNSEKYVVVNGGEDEPGSIKDRTLLVYSPHAVLEGALLAAYAVGASINSQDLNAFANAVQAAPALLVRLQQELADPNSAFGT